MCFGSGGGSVQTGPRMQTVTVTDPTTGQTSQVEVEEGVPADFAARGAKTIVQYQIMAQQDLADRTLKAQQENSDKQQKFNEEQAKLQQDQYNTQQQQVQDQAARQSTYDTGRAQALDEGAAKVNQAFSRFSPTYFGQYQQDYMAKAQDQIDYQRRLAERESVFGQARSGKSGSQAAVNELGLIGETAGRTEAEQAVRAQQARADQENTVLGSRQNLLNQVIGAQSISSPIAPGTIGDVNTALQTQRNAISPISTTAGDVAANLQAVPPVSTLSNIFAGLVQGGGSFLTGLQAGSIPGYSQAGLAARPPGSAQSTTTRID